MRVLVTDGDSRAALAVVRSLGRRGHHVIVGARRSPALAQTSRHCRERMTYPDPFGDGNAFAAALLAEVESRKVDVLLPTAHASVRLRLVCGADGIPTTVRSSNSARFRSPIAPH